MYTVDTGCWRLAPAPGYNAALLSHRLGAENVFSVDVEPDLITVAKSLAAGFPLSGVVGKAQVMDAPDPGGIADGGVSTRVIPLRGEARDLAPWTAEGDHGGGDRLMLEDIFLPQPAPDKYLRAADELLRVRRMRNGQDHHVALAQQIRQTIRCQHLVHAMPLGTEVTGDLRAQ